jgi:hypothetical protein
VVKTQKDEEKLMEEINQRAPRMKKWEQDSQPRQVK